jgi:hypothetical protein
MKRSGNELADLAAKVFDQTSIPTTAREQARVLDERAPLAEELAIAAFRDNDRAAWRLVQEGVFSLPIFRVTSGKTITSRRRPFFRGDIVSSGVRDVVWEVEEKYVPRLKIPEPLVGESAAQFIEGEFRKRSVQHHPLFEYLAQTQMSKEQERRAVLAYLHSVMVRIRTVHRGIMLVQIPLEFHDCIKLAKLVIDELGSGELNNAHAQMTALDIERWGGSVDWHAPVESVEMMAMLNWNLRTVTHPDSLWSYTGIFSIEWNSYLELRAAMLALRKRGVPDEMMKSLVEHGEGDDYDKDRHALLVRQELGRRIETPEDCALIFSGIAYHQSLYHGFFEGEFAKLRAQVESP